MAAIKPIETVYNGYRFRSRLEARWAVFFDVLGIEYEYEPEAYDLGEAGWYLPDFWLPQVSMFAEVKHGPFSEAEEQKCRQLCMLTNHGVLMLDGPPRQRAYWGFVPGWCATGDCPGKPLECADCEYRKFEPELWDFLLHEGNQYWLTEGRFYVSTGCATSPEDCRTCTDRWCENELGRKAVFAARAARFEHKDRRVNAVYLDYKQLVRNSRSLSRRQHVGRVSAKTLTTPTPGCSTGAKRDRKSVV